MSYANITFKNFGTCSNEDGRFELKLPDLSAPLSIKISCIGYERKIIDLAAVSVEIDVGSVVLERKITELGEVTIKAKATTVDATLALVLKNLDKNFSPVPFQREGRATVRKFDSSDSLLQTTTVSFDEYYSKGYPKRTYLLNLMQGHVTGANEYSKVDDAEFYWIDLFFLRRHDAYRYAYPYTFRKAYTYQIEKNVYEYDGVTAISILFEKIDPASEKDGGWPNAVKIPAACISMKRTTLS